MKAEAALALIKQTLQSGDLVRAKSDMAAILLRIEETLKKNPDHARLRRLSAAARSVESDLTQRIASRVRELIEDAEREATSNFDEAQRLVSEAEQLDAKAAKMARERLDVIRRQAEGDKERRERSALHVKLADYHFEQARRAAVDRRYAEARHAAAQAKVQLERAVAALAVLNLVSDTCYEVSGSGNQLRLGGGGLLAGSMLLQ